LFGFSIGQDCAVVVYAVGISWIVRDQNIHGWHTAIAFSLSGPVHTLVRTQTAFQRHASGLPAAGDGWSKPRELLFIVVLRLLYGRAMAVSPKTGILVGFFRAEWRFPT
jgi:hypothetical protein